MRIFRPFYLLAALASGLLAQDHTQLVQSVPAGLNLEDPELPFAKDVWLDMVKSARTRLDFAHFYVTNAPDTALETILQALEAAGRRGVKVRFLLSDTPRMLEQDPRTLARLKAIPNLELRLFKLQGGILHAKYLIADGQAACIGSQNFDWRALEQIHELGLRTREAALVKPMQEIFEIDWGFAGGRMPRLTPGPRPLPGPLELVSSPPHLTPANLRLALPALVELLGQAHKRIRIQLLQYSPVQRERHWPPIDNALREAAARGVKVELLVSDWCLKTPNVHHLRSLAALPNVEVRYAAIPEDPKGHIPYARVTHTKMLVVDEAVLWVGTSNWEEDYFDHSRNLELILRDPSLAARGNRVFERLWGSRFAHPIEAGGTYAPRNPE